MQIAGSNLKPGFSVQYTIVEDHHVVLETSCSVSVIILVLLGLLHNNIIYCGL